ncbi:MAG: response regulator [Verrucomicrobiota bacterium]|nr:response regulator [Verrucomicrobiota bacterium]
MHSSSQTRILVADDNLVNQKVATLQLKRFGYCADVAANGLEVLAAIEAARYDIIFMDCEMPEIDGYETTRRIRAGEAKRRAGGESFAPLYIIAVTANVSERDRLACLAAGMDDYISKPLRGPEMAEALLRIPKPAAA